MAKGDEAAFRILFREHFRSLKFFAYSFTNDMETAKDLAQDAFYKLWERRGNFHSLDSVKAFLYITVKNACINHLSASHRRTERYQEVARLAEQDDSFAEALVIKEELLKKIVMEIDELPDKYGRIIKLAFVEGLNHQQIAGRLAISEATVRKQKERGLKLLKAIVVKKKLGVLLATVLGWISWLLSQKGM